MYIYTKLVRYHEDSLNYHNRITTARNKYIEESSIKFSFQ